MKTNSRSKWTTIHTTKSSPDVPPPPDATDILDWDEFDDGVRRMFYGTARGTGPHVNIAGWQYADGTVQRAIVLDAGYLKSEFDPTGARAYARLIDAAAHELGRLM